MKPIAVKSIEVECTDLDNLCGAYCYVLKLWPKELFGKVPDSGIHLLEPTEYEMDRAIDNMFRDGFETIHVYASHPQLIKGAKS